MELTHPNENFFIRHATAIAIGAVTVLVLMAVVTFWRQSQANEEARGWVNHTYVVRRHIQLLLSGLQNAETGQRGYVLTGNKDFLEPYDDALRDGTGAHVDDAFADQHRSIGQEMTLLRKLTSDNPSQQSNMDEMEDGVKKFLDFLATTIQKRQNADATAAKSVVTEIDFHHQKEIMDHLRGMVRIMLAEEYHLLTLRTELDESTSRQNNTLTFIAMAIFYIAITFSIWIYQRSRARAAAESLR